MTIEDLLDELVEREGGYVDHPADRGGPTCWGITQEVARAAGWTGPMRRLPRPLAIDIYQRRYWLSPGLHRVAERAPTLAAELFDTGVNMGPTVAAGFLQRTLNAMNRGRATGRTWASTAGSDRRHWPRSTAFSRGAGHGRRPC